MEMAETDFADASPPPLSTPLDYVSLTSLRNQSRSDCWLEGQSVLATHLTASLPKSWAIIRAISMGPVFHPSNEINTVSTSARSDRRHRNGRCGSVRQP
jgi:hypothetical protein